MPTENQLLPQPGNTLFDDVAMKRSKESTRGIYDDGIDYIRYRPDGSEQKKIESDQELSYGSPNGVITV